MQALPVRFGALPLLLGTLLTSACVEDPGDDTGTKDGTVDAPAPVEGCVAGDGPVVDVVAALADMPTVVRVTWRTAAVTAGAVSFTTATGPRQTATSVGTTHEALLVGNRADTDVPFRIVTDLGDEITCGVVRTITTGALPSGLPDLAVAIDASYPVEGGGYTVAPIIQRDTSYVVLLDSGGEYVWAWADRDHTYGGTYFNADVDLARGGIFVNEQAISASLPGAIRHIGFDGTEQAPVLVEGGHTDFVELPGGAVASLSWEIREVDGGRYLGDRIVETDAAGEARTVWSVWDDYAPDTTAMWPTGFYQDDLTVMDWSHLNALAYDVDADAFVVSMPFAQAIARVDRGTGEVAWELAGPDLVSLPHSAQLLDETVLVFNRGEVSDPEACSEAKEIRLADESVVWSYQSEPCLLVPFLGNARRLPDGNTLVDFSSAGQLDEVSPSGELLWRVNLGLGAAFGFADRVDGLYPASGR